MHGIQVGAAIVVLHYWNAAEQVHAASGRRRIVRRTKREPSIAVRYFSLPPQTQETVSQNLFEMQVIDQML